MQRAMVLVAMLAACAGSDDGAVGPDAPTDPMLGTWIRVPVVGLDGVTGLTFSAGGRWTADGTFGADAGSYQIDSGSWLTLAGGAHVHTEGAYLLAGDQLMLQAYLPEGTPAGIVGTWVAHYATDALVEARLQVAADGTVSLATTSRGDTTTATGTWTEEPRGFVVALGATPGSPFHFRTMGGAAVGTQLYERAP